MNALWFAGIAPLCFVAATYYSALSNLFGNVAAGAHIGLEVGIFASLVLPNLEVIESTSTDALRKASGLICMAKEYTLYKVRNKCHQE